MTSSCPTTASRRPATPVQKLQERRALHPTFDAMYAHWPSYGRFTFASTAVGAAWGAIEHFASTLASSTRVANALGGTVRPADQDYVATEFAEAAGDVQMAMLLIEKRSFEAAERARRHLTPSETDLVSHHVTLNWRQSAVRYLNAAVLG
jgi:hypothetical protein